MTKKNKDFKEKYKHHPIRMRAKSIFNEASKNSINEKTKKYMCQVMATIGLELEARFDDIITFDDDNFKLFGREKSKKSIAKKKKLLIQDFDRNLKESLEDGKDDIPTRIRPIFDYYAFKLVCPHIEDTSTVIDTVIFDVLDDIQENFPLEYQEIIYAASNQEGYSEDQFSYKHYIDLINNRFSDRYPYLTQKISIIKKHKKETEDIQDFLDSNSSIDVSSLTYKEYYKKIIDCYSILSKLAYKESFEEREYIERKINKAKEQLINLKEEDKIDENIPDSIREKYGKKLNKLMESISLKRTNKLDLAVGDLMVYDILTTSKSLKRLGVTCSRDPSRTKKKRNPNGYVANFYSLDMPNGLTSEIQVQSRYRFEYGERGPAAHEKIGKGLKKRTLYKRPKGSEKYKSWEKKQFKALPNYFTYKTNGIVHIYNTFDNFKKYYASKKDKKVKKYIQYIAEHNIDLLNTKFETFSLDSPSVLDTDAPKDSESR